VKTDILPAGTPLRAARVGAYYRHDDTPLDGEPPERGAAPQPGRSPQWRIRPRGGPASSRSLGLVFGDIGTSPIYTLTVVVALTVPTAGAHPRRALADRLDAVALVTVEYAWLAMSLSKRGEGGRSCSAKS